MPTYLLTGTTRGIGRGLVSSLLLRPNHTIIAGVRDTNAAAAESLEDLPKGEGSKLVLVRIDASQPESAKEALERIREEGVDRVDVVIANAGIYDELRFIGESELEEMRGHFEVNTLGVMGLFQATKGLLEKADGGRFVVTSTAIASITRAPYLAGVPGIAYGASKAAVNYFVAKAVGEFPGIGFLAVHPGLVKTDMATEFMKFAKDLPVEAITVEESVRGYLNVLDKPVEETNGKFLDWQGEELPW